MCDDTHIFSYTYNYFIYTQIYSIINMYIDIIILQILFRTNILFSIAAYDIVDSSLSMLSVYVYIDNVPLVGQWEDCD